jgi:nucleotide-binding universal stress UspA family protein
LDVAHGNAMQQDIQRALSISPAGDPSWPVTVRVGSPPRVLAVASHVLTDSLHAVVGLDFSSASVQAARLAARLVAPNGRLTLLHVQPRFEQASANWQAWDAEYTRTMPPLFDEVRAQLTPHNGVLVETVTVRGDPAASLVSMAQQTQCDLIAVGTQRHNVLERLIVGSVATRVLRSARCSVLAVPG